MNGLSEKPERVLIISKDSTLLGNRTGFGDTLQRHIFYAEQLQKHRPGSEVRILTYSLKGFDKQETNPSPGLRIYGTSSSHRALFLVDAIGVLKHLFSDGWKPTVITTQEPWEDGQLGLWLAKRHNARFIPQTHFDILSKDWLWESFLNPLKWLIANYTLRRADKIRAVSQEQKQKLVQSLGLDAEDIHIIPVGVSFRPTTKTRHECQANLSSKLLGKKVVLFVGRLYAQKNPALWVDVVQQIYAKLPNTCFLIAGDGPLMEETQKRVQDKGLEDAFVFLGNVAYQNLPEVFGAADMLLLTSNYEGFGRVIVEAYMAGLPVVATACTGPEDIVLDGETGYLCAPGDQQGLVKASLGLLQNDHERVEFGGKGQNRMKSLFSREHLTNLLVKMWEAE